MLIYVIVVILLIVFMWFIMFGLCQTREMKEKQTKGLSLQGGGMKEKQDTLNWLDLVKTHDDTINEYSKSIYNFKVNNVEITMIGETHDKSECGLINFDNLNHVNRNILLIFEDTNNEGLDIKFSHPFGIHYKDPRFKFYFDDPKNKYIGDYDYWFDENRLKTEPNNLPKNVYYYPSDHREMYCYSPIFSPYFNFYRNSNSVISKNDIKGIPETFHPTIEDIKSSKLYNPNKDDSFYNKLIKKYSYDSYKQFIDIIVKTCCKMNKLDAFNEITFEKYEDRLTSTVKKYFKNHNTNHYIGFINVVNDVFALNEIDKVVNSIDNSNHISQIITYGGSFHLNVYTEFINENYKNETKDNKYIGYDEPRIQKFLKSITL